LQTLGYLADAQTVGTDANQKAKYCHTRRLCKGGEGGDGGFLIHISIMPEISFLDKEQVLL